MYAVHLYDVYVHHTRIIVRTSISIDWLIFV